MLYARRPDPSPAQDTIQLFRAHNQRRWALEKDVVALEERVPFVCECANADCFQPIGLTMHEFEAAHMCPNWHAVLPGHADSADETVLVRDDHFWTVEVKGTVRACNRTEVDMALEAMAVEDADRLLDEAWLNGGDLERALALAKRLSREIGRDPDSSKTRRSRCPPQQLHAISSLRTPGQDLPDHEPDSQGRLARAH